MPAHETISSSHGCTTKREWVSRLHHSLTIFSPEKLSIQRFKSLGGNHLHLAFTCICLRVIRRLINTVPSNTALVSHLPKTDKNLCNLTNPNHLIF